MQFARAGNVADCASATRACVAIDGRDSRELADFEVGGRSGAGEAEGCDEEGESGVHLVKWDDCLLGRRDGSLVVKEFEVSVGSEIMCTGKSSSYTPWALRL
jgi:hypothetical protein